MDEIYSLIIFTLLGHLRFRGDDNLKYIYYSPNGGLLLGLSSADVLWKYILKSQ